MYDTHVHSMFSHDGISDLREYASLVETGIIKCIGFTEHVDFIPECDSYSFFDYNNYSNTMKSYKEAGYPFHMGAEIDYAKSVEVEIEDHLKENRYEYIICSVHIINGISVSNSIDFPEIHNIKEIRCVVENYYNEVLNSLKVDEFEVIGHIGVFKRYLEENFFKRNGMHSMISEIESEIAKECALKGKIVEVNSSGLFSPVGTTIPGADFLNMYYEYGGRLISIGSDAHCTSHVGRGFSEVVKMLKTIGFEYFILPWNNQKIGL